MYRFDSKVYFVGLIFVTVQHTENLMVIFMGSSENLWQWKYKFLHIQ